jgi:hypothetical protein
MAAPSVAELAVSFKSVGMPEVQRDIRAMGRAAKTVNTTSRAGSERRREQVRRMAARQIGFFTEQMARSGQVGGEALRGILARAPTWRCRSGGAGLLGGAVVVARPRVRRDVHAHAEGDSRRPRARPNVQHVPSPSRGGRGDYQYRLSDPAQEAYSGTRHGRLLNDGRRRSIRGVQADSAADIAAASGSQLARDRRARQRQRGRGSRAIWLEAARLLNKELAAAPRTTSYNDLALQGATGRTSTMEAARSRAPR